MYKKIALFILFFNLACLFFVIVFLFMAEVQETHLLAICAMCVMHLLVSTAEVEVRQAQVEVLITIPGDHQAMAHPPCSSNNSRECVVVAGGADHHLLLTTDEVVVALVVALVDHPQLWVVMDQEMEDMGVERVIINRGVQ